MGTLIDTTCVEQLSSTSSLITFWLLISNLCLINQLLFDGMIAASKRKDRLMDHNLTTWRALISWYQLTFIFKAPKWHVLHDKLAPNQCRRLQLYIFIIVYRPAEIVKVGTSLSRVLISLDKKNHLLVFVFAKQFGGIDTVRKHHFKTITGAQLVL